MLYGKTEKISTLVDKFFNHQDTILVSEKLELLGLLNTQLGSIHEFILLLQSKKVEVKTTLAPSTFNNFIQDILSLSVNGTYNETINEKYSHINLYADTLVGYDYFTYTPDFKVPSYSKIVGNNDFLSTVIEQLDLNLAINFYLLLLSCK